jgi:predicted porin
LYGGYEHLSFANPNNPLVPGAFAAGGYNIAFVNNNNYVTDRNQDVFWVGAKYAVTPTFDVIGAYYGIRQHFFTQGAGNGAGVFFNAPNSASLNLGSLAAQQAACAAASASETNCAGAVDMASLVIDWRFARHVDFYAGVSYSQKTGGLASGFVLSTANGTLAGAAVNNRVSTYDPGVGLRYQF